MLEINHAILHSFDLASGDKYLSSKELDLEEKKTKSFVMRHLRKALNAPDNHHGMFRESSNFESTLNEYRRRVDAFIPFSNDLAEFFWGELRKGDDATPCDLLIAEFSVPVEQDAIQTSEEDAQAAFEGVPDVYFAILLLPRREIFIHSMYQDGPACASEVLRTDAALPSPSQKIDTYALINYRTMQVSYKDKPRSIAGMISYLIPDGLLACTKEASSKEAVEAVVSVVEEVADAYGMNSAVALSKAKAYVTEKAQHAEEIVCEEVAEAVFEEAQQPADDFKAKYEKVAAEQRLPEEVIVKKTQATRMTKNHKIKTDTGIELVFPSEYANDCEYLEFITEEDGTLSIRLKNITSLENK